MEAFIGIPISSIPGQPTIGLPVAPGGPTVGLPIAPGGPVVGLPIEPGGPVVGLPIVPGGPVVGLPVAPGGPVVGRPVAPGGPVIGLPPGYVNPEQPVYIQPVPPPGASIQPVPPEGGVVAPPIYGVQPPSGVVPPDQLPSSCREALKALADRIKTQTGAHTVTLAL